MHQWQIPKSHGNILNICLFGETTKQPLNNFETWKPRKYKQIGGLEPDSSCL